MPPISVGTSHFTLALETGQAKLWIFLVGVNQYEDHNLPTLRYSALDCQGLGDALSEATQAFPQKEIIIHHDFVDQKPILEVVKASLESIVTSAKTQDTVLFYFSGHGLLEPESQQTVLCLADTNQENLLQTGLTLQELLAMFNHCAAHCQVVWLDACHCGNMTLTGAKGNKKDSLSNPTTHLLEALRRKAAKSKGFYALLSCDQGQQSWEFPDLGHGVFSYYLMRGLRGDAANARGVIEADGLYRYVYNQTLQYIEKANQQLRLINQQKRHRGEPQIYSEYSLQTPKRIVEGVGEFILGLKKNANELKDYQRHALMIEGLTDNPISTALQEVFEKEGYFTVEKILPTNQEELEIRNSIQSFFQSGTGDRQHPATLLLYLRGRLEVENKGESYLVLENGIKLSRSWLRKELRRSNSSQQIVILDCHGTGSIDEWLEELKTYADHGQCLLGALAPEEDIELFAQILLESLIAANPQVGLSVAEWLTKLQTNCEQLGITFSAWLSGIHGVIDILPGNIEESLQTIPQTPALISVPLIKEEIQLQQPPQTQANPISPEQYASLTQFLTELIGPVALTLLNSIAAQTSCISVLLDDLSQYLSPSQKIKLDKWASDMMEKTEPLKQDLPQPQSKEATNTNLLPEQYNQLELILREIIGPIAPLLLSQTTLQFQQNELVIASLKDYLTPHQKAQFETQILSLMGETEQSSTIDEVPPSETTPMMLNETLIAQCEQELTQIIGPVAQYIITTTLQDQPQISRSEFIETIAAEIPNPNQATDFRQRWLTK